ncbi:fumarylacetoacetate hydrolase family protein [Dongia rigui]|uniref:Fumarylacetoacetate hydrolase family protein n=1 Tax=Dongia rigui TaxID=940149 RepID=A0ABU5DYN8_9PROT|nr:fumarylacetoacetate hydrolase family protein [Dongia rigui]MDY0872410.1 fumarylacetoacetate hydrolase family protein [Dongia rigui]
MKLASLKNGTRDGALHVVDRALKQAVPVTEYPTLQAALDDWAAAEPVLRALSRRLNAGEIEGNAFDATQCLSPLPRAYQWADGSAYVNHVALVRQARGAEMPASFWTDPLMYQGGSDTFLGPTEAIPLRDPTWGCDFEAEIAVVTDDVALGSSVAEAASRIRLVMLVNDVSLRGLIPDELAKGFGFFQSKPSSAFSPVAVTPDALGDAWDGRKLSGALRSFLNGAMFGCPDAGTDMTFDFPTLIAHAAKSRALGAGTIIGSGTVSNRGPDGGPGTWVAEGGRGYSCIAERRMVEQIAGGKPVTPFLQSGDRVRIEMLDAGGASIFGAIDQVVG